LQSIFVSDSLSYIDHTSPSILSVNLYLKLLHYWAGSHANNQRYLCMKREDTEAWSSYLSECTRIYRRLYWIITGAWFYVSVSIFCLINSIWLKTLIQNSTSYYSKRRRKKVELVILLQDWVSATSVYDNHYCVALFEDKNYPLSNHFIYGLCDRQALSRSLIYVCDCCNSHPN